VPPLVWVEREPPAFWLDVAVVVDAFIVGRVLQLDFWNITKGCMLQVLDDTWEILGRWLVLGGGLGLGFVSRS
jgi:hypothetical protein